MRMALVVGLFVAFSGPVARAEGVPCVRAGDFPFFESKTPLCNPNACVVAPDHALVYQFLTSTVSNPNGLTGTVSPIAPAFRPEIETAIERAWNAGAAPAIQRDALFSLSDGADETSLSFLDAKNELAMGDGTLFNAFAVPSDIFAFASVVLKEHPNCGYKGFDIIFRSSTPWSIEKPNALASTSERSIPHVAIHEIGHAMGFGHVVDASDTIAIMAESWPGGGDIANTWGIHELEFVALRNTYPGTSTGTNLSISRYRAKGQSGEERWGPVVGHPDDGYLKDVVCLGDSLYEVGGVEPTFVEITGSTSVAGVETRFFLKPVGSGVCGDSSSRLLDEEVWNLSVNGPAPVQPDLIVPINNSYLGTWKLCAIVDPDNEVAETSEGDNKVSSEDTVTVVGVGGSCP